MNRVLTKKELDAWGQPKVDPVRMRIAISPKGRSPFVVLEDELGTCGAKYDDKFVWAAIGVDGVAETRAFSVSPELASEIASDASWSAHLAPGLTVHRKLDSERSYVLRGPLAATWPQLAPNKQQSEFPLLPSAWEGEIRRSRAGSEK